MREELLNYLNQFDLYYLQKVTTKRKRGNYVDGATLREIAPNEIVIEFDTDNYLEMNRAFRITINRLKYHKYNFKVYDHSGRSPHIHVYNIIGLEDVDFDVNRMYKKLFLQKYANFACTDVAINTKETQAIALEFAPHFKHGVVKDIIFETEGFDNKIEIDILEEARETVRKREAKEKFFDTQFNVYDMGWLVNFLLDQKEYMHMMDLLIFKNVAIAVVNQNINETEFLKKLGDNMGMMRVAHMKGWLRWARNSKRKINMSEIIEFFNLYKVDFLLVREKYMINFSHEETEESNDKGGYNEFGVNGE